ncbi:filamentous hemagglutinin N-terminal domain-containing protein [Methylosinus sporium]|uniref:two-partner secretion domain-containing protein n=1 Tax=Methylosinus sporium TaxID=428 RepID=UPI00383ADDFB
MGALSATTAIAAILALPSFSLANPTGGVVVDGAATISSTTNVTNVVQSTNRAIINWQGFSIGAGETVNFLQPTAMSVTLNRVVGNEQSVISGALNANGKVFLVNSNGILFGKDAQVNVGGLVASTLDISNANFMAGNYIFSGSSAAAVVNKGTINAADGGYVALLGKTVSNEGTIKAKLGTVALASGEQMTLNFEGDSLIDVTIDKGTYNALVENKGLIKANGGQVVLTAKAADDLLSAQVNNSGIIKARTLADLTGGSTSSGGSVKVGKIKLLAQGGSVNVTGKLDASAPKGGDGGMIETSGNKVTIADSATITTAAANGATGSWIIDPDGFTIGLGGDITGAALTTQLATNNVTISSTSGKGGDGNIYVNEAVSWSGNTLTLTATNNIFVNSGMTATGTASFAANYGSGANADLSPKGLYFYTGTTNSTFAGSLFFSGSGTVALNGTNYTVITNLAGLTAVKSNLAGNYVLGANITSWSGWTGAIGDTAPFTGNFNGLGHVVNNAPLTATGFFGTIGAGAVVSNLGVRNTTVKAGATNASAIGAFANVNKGTIVNSFASNDTLTPRSSASPNVTVDYVGGFVGDNAGLIAQSFALSNVTATNSGGGFVGLNEASGVIVDGSARSNQITNTTIGAYSLGYVGGFVGVNNGQVLRSYSGNQITLTDTTSIAGGFVGLNAGSIDQSYAVQPNGAFDTGPHLAGFVGRNTGTITNAYTTALSGADDSLDWSAGFAYQNAGVIRNAYATETSPNVGATTTRSGFVSDNTGGAIQNAYWNGTVATGASAIVDSSPAKNLTATQAATFASYSGFDTTAWAASMSGFPILALLPVYVSSSTTVYGAALSLTTIGLQGGGGVSTNVDSASTIYNPLIVANSTGYVDAGTTLASRDFTSVYKNLKGTLTVSPAALTISGAVADKVYDGTTTGTVVNGLPSGGLVGLLDNQTLNINYTAAVFADKNAGTGKTATLTFTVADGTNGGKASNYTVATTTTASITPKPIQAVVTAVDKVYDGTTTATINGGSLAGVLTGDTVALDYSAATGQFADKNAGQNKTVTATGFALTGASASNYMLQSLAPQTMASITPLPLILYGTKSVDGSATLLSPNLGATNLAAGDSIGLLGSVKLAGSTAGVQTITDVSNLLLSNSNYTLAGATGSAVLGSQSLALDHVVSGSVSIATSGATTTITQTTPRAIVDWFRFSVAAGETVNFVQPSASSVILNRVTGNEESVIAGALNANGRVFILNSAGVLFTAGSSVNVGALVASTLNVSDANFNAGNYVFVATAGSGSVVAAGDIVIVDGGFLALASQNGVDASGKVMAHGGKALLASAGSLNLTLNSADAGLGTYTLDKLSGTASARGAIDVSSTAGGGVVETAGANLSVANFTPNTGANGTWSISQPTITIGAGGLSSQFVTGNLAARNLSLNAIAGDVNVNDTVSWSANTTLGLAASNNININAPIVASGASAGFTMNYGGDYNVLSPATYSGVGAVAPANAAYASVTLTGANASLKINQNSYTLIHSMAQLDAVDGRSATTAPGATVVTATGNYALAQDIDAGGASAGFVDAPIEKLSGAFAGLGHSVSNLTIASTAAVNNAPVDNLGLIGQTAAGSLVRDIGVVNANVNSSATVVFSFGTFTNLGNNLGALIGSSQGNVSKAYSTGTVSGGSRIGGLIGQSTGASSAVTTISDSFSTANVTGGSSGGLVGQITYSDVFRSHASGKITASGNSGGLVGYANNSSIYDSYATGLLDGGTGDAAAGAVGGLVGYFGNSQRTIILSNSYATGDVNGAYQLGGLIGAVGTSQSGNFPITIDKSYATGKVTGYQSSNSTTNPGIGGLIGYANGYRSADGRTTVNVNITSSYATGNVGFSGVYGTSAGGLVGTLNYGVVNNSYATGNVTGGSQSSGAGGLIGSGLSTNISNSHASGDVTGNLTVGGLISANSGIITNSYASGNVTGGSNNVGGLVGNNTGLGTITGSYATGNVTSTGATSSTGGLAGANGGVITNSYSTGVVTGASGYAGGLIGSSYSGGVTTNSYYNSEVNPGLPLTNYPTASSGTPPGRIKSGSGLTTTQMRDISSYLNGTINRVLADRATAAATQAARNQAGESAGNVIANGAEAISKERPNFAVSTASGRAAVAAVAAAPLDENIQGGETAQTPLPAPRARAQHASVTSGGGHKVRASSPGAHYRARIRGIDVDGQHFDLGPDGKNSAPAPKAQ